MSCRIDAKVRVLGSMFAAWAFITSLSLSPPATAASAQSDELARLQVLNQLTKRCLELGQYKSGLATAIYAVEIAEQLRGPNDPIVATALIGLGRILGQRGNHSREALGALSRALEIDESSSKDSPAVARDLLYLARQLRESRRFDAAAKTYARLIALDEHLYGPDSQYLARDLDSLAGLLRDMGDGSSSEFLQRRAVSILYRLYQNNPREWGLPLAAAMNNLADGLREDQRLNEAEDLFRRSLALNEQQLGFDSIGVAVSLNNLAEVLRKLGRFADAEPLYVRAIDIERKNLGPSHPNLATLMGNFARLLRDTDRHKEAESLFRQVLSSDESTFGPIHPTVARDLNNLAHLMLVSKRSEEGVPLMRRAIDILKRQEADSGAAVFEIGQALGFLGELVVAAGDAHGGEGLFQQGLAVDERNYGKGSAVVEKDLRRYAGFLLGANRAAEADELSRRAGEIAGAIARNRQVSEQHARCLVSDCDRSL